MVESLALSIWTRIPRAAFIDNAIAREHGREENCWRLRWLLKSSMVAKKRAAVI